MKPGDKALGMDQPICRRDFLNSTLLASGSLLLKSLSPLEMMAQETSAKTGGLNETDWNGPTTGVGDYTSSNGNTWNVVNAGHDIRFGVFEKGSPEVTEGEVFDCVVVGGGLAGLSAAWTFKKNSGSKRTCLILENHPMFGGEAKRNDLMVDGHRIMGPQGSNLIWAPEPGTHLEGFLNDIRLDWQHAEYVPWGGPGQQMELSRTSYSWIYIMPPTFGFYFGQGFGQPTRRLGGGPMGETPRRGPLFCWDS